MYLNFKLTEFTTKTIALMSSEDNEHACIFTFFIQLAGGQNLMSYQRHSMFEGQR